MRTNAVWRLCLGVLLGGAAAFIPCPAAAEEDSAPAAVQQGLRLNDLPVHDPYIVAHEPSQTYYLYTSASPRDTGERRFGVKAYTSRDLVDWTGPHVVFEIPDGIWANPMDGAWAPEVHEYEGRFYLFVTLHNDDIVFAEPPEVWRPNHLRGSVVAVADAPDGPFELLKPEGPHPPREFMTLDGSLYVNCSRFLRPGAARLGTSRSDGASDQRQSYGLMVSAYRSADGARPVVVVNYGTDERQLTWSSTVTMCSRGSRM